MDINVHLRQYSLTICSKGILKIWVYFIKDKKKAEKKDKIILKRTVFHALHIFGSSFILKFKDGAV